MWTSHSKSQKTKKYHWSWLEATECQSYWLVQNQATKKQNTICELKKRCEDKQSDYSVCLKAYNKSVKSENETG